MNIAHVNMHYSVGGAAVAVRRLMEGLSAVGHQNHMFVGEEVRRPGPIVNIEQRAMGLHGVYRRSKDSFLRNMEYALGLPDWWRKTARQLNARGLFSHADIINLHNIHGGFFNFRDLKLISRQKPVVWTMHDMWPLTGACAFSYDCSRWENGCFDCPLLKPEKKGRIEPYPISRDQTSRIWKEKRKVFSESKLFIVTPSKWLSELARRGITKTFNINCIPNGVDPDAYSPRDRHNALSLLNLDPGSKYILCSAAYYTYRKGYDILKASLEILRRNSDFTILALGHGGLNKEIKSEFKVVEFGHVSNTRLQALLISAADVFAFPSRADNQPLTVLEAMACGTPVVGFSVGGVGELIDHMETGYLAKPEDSVDFARGLEKILQNDGLRRKMTARSRQVVLEKYTIAMQVKGYSGVYAEAIEDYNADRQLGGALI